MVVPAETKYARSGDVHIAYQVVGEGPLDLVFVMGWFAHLDVFGWSPVSPASLVDSPPSPA